MNLENTRILLGEFRFRELFVEELGWNQPTNTRSEARDTKGVAYTRKMLSQLSGVAVFQITGGNGLFDRKSRELIERDIARDFRENLCVFLDRDDRPTQSFWVWANRDRDDAGRQKRVYREHSYFRGQPADLFIGKLQALVVELSELDDDGNLPVTEVARRMKDALDVERVTKKFYRDYETQHGQFIELIEGIPNDRDRHWYASIVLNRLMFVWFLQKKGFIDAAAGASHGDFDYLTNRLADSKKRGKNRFFGEFLKALFFEAFAKPIEDRSQEALGLTGRVRYLNGGLFLPHALECDASGAIQVGSQIRIPDTAFEDLFSLFGSYTWNLDDTPGGQADEINPDVLGYIFEKYINQKAFGAYYTRPEITDYLSEHAIYALILERVRKPALPELNLPAIEFDSVPEMLARMDGQLAAELLNTVLPSLKLLDPAVGSGAFLVAAMKTLINVYTAIVGKAELGTDRELKAWLKRERGTHKNLSYAIKRRIITDNLFGVDIMEEATEIARLRLFLALIASARSEDELEPLPNIDFNVMPGNSLVGLMRVDDAEFDQFEPETGQAATIDMFRPSYRELLAEKNRLVDSYRHAADTLTSADLSELRRNIDEKKAEANAVLNELLRDEFERLGVKFEQATWDSGKGAQGRAKSRRITVADIAAQRPFHWGYEFDEIMQRQGGFDAIITNPPWETFKPQAKEFFAEHSDLVSKNKMTIKEFEKEQDKKLKIPAVREAWLEYQSRFPHMNLYYRNAAQYAHQVAHSDGKKIVTDINLYKLFLEQCFNLLRPGGLCGIVIPSGIYTDLGAKALRELLFERTRIEGLFCFENRKEIFEGVHRSFKFVVLTFLKSELSRVAARGERTSSAPPDDLLAPTRIGARGTRRFPAAFMRHDVTELSRFPKQGAIEISVDLVKRLAPDSYSIMEFKSPLDIVIAEKLIAFPSLGDPAPDGWDLGLCRELHMTDNSNLFKTEKRPGRLPLWEGKQFHQFDANFAEPKYWLSEKEARQVLLDVRVKRIQRMLNAQDLSVEPDVDRVRLDYTAYRLAFRDVARSTDERTMIATILPPDRICPHTVSLETVFVDIVADGINQSIQPIDDKQRLYLVAMLNSLVLDYFLRQSVTTHLSFFFVHNAPVPRLPSTDKTFLAIVERAARLTCTTDEFAELARSAGLKRHKTVALEQIERERLRAELDGLIARLYGLTEEEFAHILTTFPAVPDPVKVAAQNAYRAVERGLIQ
jgi:hypothetical protein